eukprot:CAMPEP_0118937824 /NCGR_PEP_ID=MMETSP1169-20130426/23914_1 /TAXON_ID=36882 /ORGANISM="Pyramimonas obovata, Strain CCMP722" /LENGTH=132 /DNA_ID=CAMNT_0006881579 /DNA_START=249 /DNA_END=643 /DNA_ORIENTATION=-
MRIEPVESTGSGGGQPYVDEAVGEGKMWSRTTESSAMDPSVARSLLIEYERAQKMWGRKKMHKTRSRDDAGRVSIGQIGGQGISSSAGMGAERFRRVSPARGEYLKMKVSRFGKRQASDVTGCESSCKQHQR